MAFFIHKNIINFNWVEKREPEPVEKSVNFRAFSSRDSWRYTNDVDK